MGTEAQFDVVGLKTTLDRRTRMGENFVGT